MTQQAFIVLYRWRLRPGLEDSFIEAWSRVTDLLKNERGSLGSRLHRGSDGLWYSYAQWPTAESREKAFALGSVDSEAGAAMDAAILERLPEIILEPVSDFLVGLGTPNRVVGDV
jgi:heme-degrading monooxygenase HmoA